MSNSQKTHMQFIALKYIYFRFLNIHITYTIYCTLTTARILSS